MFLMDRRRDFTFIANFVNGDRNVLGYSTFLHRYTIEFVAFDHRAFMVRNDYEVTVVKEVVQ